MFWVRIAKGGRRSEEDRKSGEVLSLLQSGVRATDVAKQLCIGRRSVYRIIEAAKGESKSTSVSGKPDTRGSQVGRDFTYRLVQICGTGSLARYVVT